MWKKGKAFKKGRRWVRYIYKNGRKSSKRLVSASNKKSNYRKRRY